MTGSTTQAEEKKPGSVEETRGKGRANLNSLATQKTRKWKAPIEVFFGSATSSEGPEIAQLELIDPGIPTEGTKEESAYNFKSETERAGGTNGDMATRCVVSRRPRVPARRRRDRRESLKKRNERSEKWSKH